jgi:DNA-binding GntR family transcriptional regulator
MFCESRGRGQIPEKFASCRASCRAGRSSCGRPRDSGVPSFTDALADGTCSRPLENGLGAPASLQQRVYENLRNSLIGGRFAPGKVLSLRRIAAANGVSPMPVREAVKRLISEGAIELLPNRTIAVPKLRRRDFMELTRVREMLEGHAAELAAGLVSRSFVLALAKKNIELIQCVVDHDMAGPMRMNQ